MDHDDIDFAQIDRYLAGESSDPETAEVEAWLAGDPARRALFEAMRSAEGRSAWDVNAAWSALRSRALQPATAEARMSRGERVTDPPPAPGSAAARAAQRSGIQPAVLLRAAAVVVVVGAAVVASRVLLERQQGDTTATLVMTTARMQSDTVRLDDGSLVILAARSRLEAPRRFPAGARAVRLSGAAFFRVTADASRPFTVSAGTAHVRVVGTEFVVRTPDGSAGDVTVAVAEGIVNVRAQQAPDAQAVVVHRGQVARVTADGVASVEAAPDLDLFLGWIEGRLVFDDAPLRDIFAELQRWYPLAFRAEDRLLDRRVTARLRAGSLDETVDALALALGAAYRRANDTITFTLTQGPR